MQWPPFPTVEDEAAALAKEHSADEISGSLKLDDQLVPSRGVIDQYPVIVELDTNTYIPAQEARKLQRDPRSSKRAERSRSSVVFRDETGLPTPPPSDTELRGRQYQFDTTRNKDEEPRAPRSKSITGMGDNRQSRPAITRIQTDVNGEGNRRKSRVRRDQSACSNLPERHTFRAEATNRSTRDSYLSPAHATASPGTYQSSPVRQARASTGQDYDSSTDSDRRPKRSIRFAEQQGPAAPQRHDDDIASEHISRWRATDQIQTSRPPSAEELNPRESRGLSRALVDQTQKDEYRRTHRSKSRSSRPASRVRDTAYASSADESVRSDRYASTKKSSSDEHSVRRRSSHRRERPRLQEPLAHIIVPGKSAASDDDATRRVYHVRDRRSPMTPPTVSTPNHKEDYFGKSFHGIASEPSSYTPRSSVDGISLHSAPNSPPRTPRCEQLDRQEHFGTPPSSLRHLPQQSKVQSVDESYYRDASARNSLLSQATHTAASLAARASPPLSRSTSNALETTFACSSNALPSKPRSRASSPQRERTHRSETLTYGEQIMSKVSYPAVPSSKRPSTRDGGLYEELPKATASVFPSILQPQRNASWTGYDPQYQIQGAQFGGPLHTMTAISNVLPTTQLNVAPPMYRSQSASTPQELMQRPKDFNLPVCPRSQPTQGLRDWTTIRDISSIDICPRCAQAISTTPYRDQLARSPEKRYNQSTICALSKPWVRIAFIQSIKQNKKDLFLVEKATFLPSDARPCEGSRPDVRMWWMLVDPDTHSAIPDFFACSACVSVVHAVFADIPEPFRRNVLSQEKVCGLHSASKNFNKIVEHLDTIAEKFRDRKGSKARNLQPLVDYIKRITRYRECARDALVTNRAWHFMSDLPEFTICEACYADVVWPQKEKSIARDISKVIKPVPHSAFRGSGIAPLVASNGVISHPVGCQLYSERMRRLFSDVVNRHLSFELFRNKVKERYAAQYRLTEMNRMYEEDQRVGWDRQAEIEKNRQYWRSLE